MTYWKVPGGDHIAALSLRFPHIQLLIKAPLNVSPCLIWALIPTKVSALYWGNSIFIPGTRQLLTLNNNFPYWLRRFNLPDGQHTQSRHYWLIDMRRKIVALYNKFHPTGDVILILRAYCLNGVLILTKENHLIKRKLGVLPKPEK